MPGVRRVVAAVVTVLLLAGCGPAGPPGDQREAVGTLVAHWSEADDEAIHDVPGLEGPLLVTGPAELQAFRADLPASADTSALGDVDLSREVLVIGAYAQCREYGRVVVSADARTLAFQVVWDVGSAICAWSPREVEVWSVPRDGLPEELTVEGYDHLEKTADGRYVCQGC